MICTLDTETCGLHGMAVLLQYQFDDSEINLHNIWESPIWETLELIEKITHCEVLGFNLAFDWFHLCKLYTVLSLFPDHNAYPVDHIDEIALLEPKGRFGSCLRPKSACDLMLWARKGPYQSLMAREDIRIRKVPAVLAQPLAEELERRVVLDAIYDARRKNPYAPKWKIFDTKEPNLKDVVRSFAPKSDLKTLALHCLDIKQEDLLRFTDVELDMYPKEHGWAPFALAVGRPGHWNGAWPEIIRFHITHWGYHKVARKYATDDVKYTRGLKECETFQDAHFGDDDSELACMVAAVRWRGFNVDVEQMKVQSKVAKDSAKGIPMAPKQAAAWIGEVLGEASNVIADSTKKQLLEKMAEEKCDCTYDDPVPETCDLCKGSRLHPAAVRASAVLDARKATKQSEIYDKIITAARFHASFIVIGTLSSRMAGSDGLNAQGINSSKEVRKCFLLADDGFVLCGGDFDSFEVVLADAAYKDPKLREALQVGQSIHGLFGAQLYPELGYDGVMESKGSKVKDYYRIAKSCVFAMLYGGDENTLVNKYNIDVELATKAYQGFMNEYPKVGEARERIVNMFCSMRQNATGRVEWNEPAEYIESLTGFRRYFTLENMLCKTLFELAEKPPKEWSDLKLKVTRNPKKGEQFVGGAVRSALYGAAFAVQSAAMRAASNHVIQSTGATITKELQCAVWKHQPVGVHEWMVVPCNIHDEVLAPCKPEVAEAVKASALEVVEKYRDLAPLIAMEWKIGMKNWAEK